MPRRSSNMNRSGSEASGSSENSEHDCSPGPSGVQTRARDALSELSTPAPAPAPKTKRIRQKPRKVECGVCKKAFSANYIKAHVKTHASLADRPKKYQCKKCHHTFTTHQNLHNHERIHCPEKPECDGCGKTFARPDLLVRHQKKSCHGVDGPSRKYRCQECGAKYKMEYLLKKHKALHSQKKWNCPHCGKKFKRTDFVKRHYKVCKVLKARRDSEAE